jgi:galactokinase
MNDVPPPLHTHFPAGARPRIFAAPGRVNLIGEHTDYNDGFVMPAAIDFHTWVAAAPRTDNRLVVHSVDFHETREFDLREANPQPERHWSDYVRGVALALQQAGYRLGGIELAITGNVPIGAGVSSSASLLVAAGLALVTINGHDLRRQELAQLCRRAENEFVGARVGIMDQFVSANAVAGHALLLDCRSLEFETVPLPAGFSLVICNTMVKHEIAGGEYNQRRAQCEEGVRLLREATPGQRAEPHSLRDVTPELLEQYESVLSQVVYRRCRHVVAENARVLAFRDALRRGDLGCAGELMAASHRSLRDDYEVSCPELDLMVQLANEVSGTVGARMTGGGFGGCTVNLARNGAVEEFRSQVARGYEERTGRAPEIYVSQAVAGAKEIGSR